MKRKLTSQMRIEWRSNIWMIIQLTTVSVILWAIVWMFIHFISTMTRDFGYDLTNTYMADIAVIPQSSPLYQPYDSTHSYFTDRQLLMARLADDPRIESVGLGINAMPYNYNFSGYQIKCSEADSSFYYMGNSRVMTPEVVEMIRLEGLDGQSSGELADMLRKGEILISDFDYSALEPVPDPYDFVGRDVMVNGDSSSIMRVGAVVHAIRRNDLEPVFGGCIIVPLTDQTWATNMLFRFKPGCGHDFIESMKPSQLEQGNIYLSNLTSIDRMRDIAQIQASNTMKVSLTCCIFLLIVVFLGFLGTFWFRTQQRVSEIAIRMVNGATRADILRRFISEGLILLLIATLAATVIESFLIYDNIISFGLSVGNPLVQQLMSMVVTFLMLVVMVIAGVWIPARKAMNVNPAYALKDQ